MSKDWRVAKSLIKLRDQVNTLWPGRSKDSDGSIGNAEHSARESDHNPNNNGVVCAIDITHDPKSGCDSYALAETLLAGRDPRIEFVISNRKIASSHVDPWKWRSYHGKNPHDHHVHISVKQDARLYDDAAEWKLDGKPMPGPSAIAKAVPPTLRKGDHGEAVKDMQMQLQLKGVPLGADSDFGNKTEAALKTFQRARGLVADGVCGPQTWAALAK